MSIIITGILGAIVAIWCCIEATKIRVAFDDNPDWTNYAIAGAWQLVIVTTVYAIEMFLFIKLIENSENIPSIYNFSEFIQSAFTGLLYMGCMYVVATGYAIGAKLKAEN